MVIRRLCRIVMHLFFSTVRVHHRERIPSTGPVLLVSNHHSSLVDPVALLATMPRLPRFLAKSVLWNAKYLPLRPLLWLARAIPVYRHVDGGGDNESMFRASHDVLAEHGVIALFGEGVSHNLPGLLDLKTGAARIALGVEATVTIVPVGLIYDDRATYRSRAMVYVGEPIVVEGSAGGDADRERVRALTSEIAAGLDDVAPSWESWKAHNAAMMAARLMAADAPDTSLAESLVKINQAVDDDTTEGHAVLDAVTSLEAESARIGLDVETVVDRPRHRVRRLDALALIGSALYFLPTVVGRLVNLPPHWLVGVAADRQALNFQATFKILFAAVVYPIWWLVVATAATVWAGPWFGVLAIIAMPLLGYIAARTYGRLRRHRNRQVVRSRTRGLHGESELIALRHDVLDATAAVLAA